MSQTHLELTRDPARTFPQVTDADGVRSARIWHCKYRSLAPLAELQNLEELVIATFPDESFDFLAKLANLRYLSIMHLPKASDLAPLASLTRLSSLSLSTLPGWDGSGKRTIVESLEPLADLPELAHLELMGVRPQDDSLRPLERCKGLRTARIVHYPRAETKRFFAETSVLDGFNPAPSFG